MIFLCYIQREFRVHLQQNIPIAFLKVLHPDVPCKYHGKCHITLKGTSDAKFTLTWCLHICFSRVWTQLTYNSLLFLNPPKNWSLNFQEFSEQNDIILLRPRPRLLMDCPLFTYFRSQPVVCHPTFSPCFQVTAMSRKQCRRFVVGCKSEHKSLHFLSTPEPPRRQWINIVFDGNAP